MLTIDTVERFQGSERDTIIITLPLKHSDNLSQLQSLSDDGRIDRKLNVALSRAKERIIVLGNLELCQTGAHYAKLIYDIGQKGIIIDSALALQQLQVNYT
jgi:DNA replication ATP-dependent helicase Dna2